MTNEEIDWSKAPEGAIGALIAKPECVHSPRITFVAEVGEYGCMIRGKACDGRPLSAPREFWEWVDIPFPRVGSMVNIDDMGLEIWPEAQCLIGINVKVLATYRAGDTDMIVVDAPDGTFNVCFRAEMARPAKTPEQIAAEEREAEIITLATLLAGHQTAWETQRETAAYLYDAGYRKPKPGAQ